MKIINYTRAIIRFILLLIWSLVVSLVIFVVLIFATLIGKRKKAGRSVAHKFFNIFLRGTHKISGLDIKWHGAPPNDPHVIMGNHRSYADAVVLPVSFPVVFVARHETKSWPIIGWGATLIGTIWVKRDKKESRRATREALKERLNNGYGIVIFPEGTTAMGPELLPYHKGMFYTCAEHGFPIAPAAIEYEDPDIAWVNAEWFIPHALKHFGKRRVVVHVSFGPSFRGTDAEKLLVDVRDWTQEECLKLREIIKEEQKK